MQALINSERKTAQNSEINLSILQIKPIKIADFSNVYAK